MELRLGYKDNAGPDRVKDGIKFWPVYLCFIIFGAIIPFTKPERKLRLAIIAFYCSGSWLFSGRSINQVAYSGEWGFGAEQPPIGPGSSINRDVIHDPLYGPGSSGTFRIRWEAVMPFASAAIMTAAATSGTELRKKGAQGSKTVIIPSVVAFVLSTGWMVLVGILP